MYLDFYQMAERPFNVTPDPKCLYLNARYREALASLQYGITQRKGFVTLIGEAGTGKTTILKKLLDQLDDKTKSVLIFNTHVTFEEILEYLFAEFDLPLHNGKRLYMLHRLNAFLLEELSAGGNVALLIDEAQDLDYSVLEDLRLLSNLETAKEKILQIVLCGQPELGEKLSSPSLRQLRQRVAVSCRLAPLTRGELGEYIQYRLDAAGCKDLKLFSRDAEDEIFRFSGGVPRLINVVCDNALVIGYALGKRRLGGDVISEAAADLMSVQGDVESEQTEETTAAVTSTASRARPSARLGLVALVLVAILIGLLSVGRSVLQRTSSTEIVAESGSAESAAAQPVEVIRPGSLRPSSAVNDGGQARPAGGVTTHPMVDTLHEPPVRGSPSEPAARVVAEPKVGKPQEAPVAGTSEAALSEFVAGPMELVEDQPQRAPAGAPEPVRESAAAIGSDVATSVGPEFVTTGAVDEPAVPTGAPSSAPASDSQPVVSAVDPGVSVPEEPAVVPAERITEQPKTTPTLADIAETVSSESKDAETVPDVRVPSDASMRLVANRADQVTIRPGDSLSAIAISKYGRVNHALLDLLKLANPQLRDLNIISVGETIQLPDLSDGMVVSLGANQYGVLVYSTPSRSKAMALRAALGQHGQRSRVNRDELDAEHPTYRVVIEGFHDRQTAAAAGKEVQRLFRDDGRMAALVK